MFYKTFFYVEAVVFVVYIIGLTIEKYFSFENWGMGRKLCSFEKVVFRIAAGSVGVVVISSVLIVVLIVVLLC